MTETADMFVDDRQEKLAVNQHGFRIGRAGGQRPVVERYQTESDIGYDSGIAIYKAMQTDGIKHA